MIAYIYLYQTNRLNISIDDIENQATGVFLSLKRNNGCTGLPEIFQPEEDTL